MKVKTTISIINFLLFCSTIFGQSYKIVDANQEGYYDTIIEITTQLMGERYYNYERLVRDAIPK